MNNSRLQNELDSARIDMEKMLPQEILDTFEKTIREISDSNIASGLSLGTQAPDFSLPDYTGRIITLSEETTKGPVVLIFYRGHWCPFCNLQLKAYQRYMDEITSLNAQLIAISPQTSEHSMNMQQKNELSFHVLSDMHNQTAEKYNLNFRLPEYAHEIYKSLDISLDTFNGDSTWELPVPATYVIDSEGMIRARVADADYKKRMEPAEVLQILRSLKSS
ncbi:alkyl hydroperoxide reductase [Paenibacillus jamilae]|uniref:Alkyl hydroperoxide reductase n=1 Tax=Paenibacillus jamilae TaxID=114136 RepID=A0ACC4ZUN5_9BACL|nr:MULTISPECIES: peroxiredoxin-like family protein [Paenibacillus]AUO09499.1 alkyl hydroperoxide reductase [Paenibacillus sp. lzh-N1]AZH28829.1 AhpC/TSA family protein [Paenibacillus sp. M-152]KTS82317.1 alkyl hydroperoxide reductase [Paenibacillus jamilae]